jgi:hypothetical protein
LKRAEGMKAGPLVAIRRLVELRLKAKDKK